MADHDFNSTVFPRTTDREDLGEPAASPATVVSAPQKLLTKMRAVLLS